MAASANAAAAGHLGGSVGFTTDYLLRGVSQSHGTGALQADLHYQTPSGWATGLWASSVDLNPPDGKTVEFNVFAGHSWRLTEDWSAKLVAIHYAYPWNKPAGHYDYDESIAGVAYRDLVFLNVAVSPNAPRESASGRTLKRTAASCDLVLRRPIGGKLSIMGGAGRYEVGGSTRSGYWYWNGGLGYDMRRWHLEMSYFGTSSSASALFDRDMPRDHWAATLLWRF